MSPLMPVAHSSHAVRMDIAFRTLPAGIADQDLRPALHQNSSGRSTAATEHYRLKRQPGQLYTVMDAANEAGNDQGFFAAPMARI